MKCIEARAVRLPEVWKFYGSLMHFPTGGANGAQNVSVDTTQLAEKITTRRIYKNIIM